jgi:hypothetical protein
MDKISLHELYNALEQSLKLQSQYAELLNMYDGGKRMQFSTPEEWVERLRKIGDLPGKVGKKG